MILLDETSAIRAKVNAMTTIRKLSSRSRFNIYQSVNKNTAIMELKYFLPNWCDSFVKLTLTRKPERNIRL